MNLVLTIDGIERRWELDSLSVSSELRGETSLTVVCPSVDASWTPAVGQAVLLEDRDSPSAIGKVFGGTIDERRTELIGTTGALLHTLRCVSHKKMFSRRTTGVRSYTNQYAGAIFADLIANCMGGDWTSVEYINGPKITISFEYAFLSDAFDAIAEAASVDHDGSPATEDTYYWDATPDKVARFFKQTTYPAPFDILELEGQPCILEKPSVTESRESYYNRAYVRLSKLIRDEATETFPGNGTATWFSVTYPIAAVPTITVDGIEQTVGIYNVDSGKDWYWQIDNNTIYQDDSGTPLTVSQLLSVTYLGFDTQTVLYQSDDAVNERAAIEGGTGYYEAVIDSSNPGTRSEGMARAEAYVNEHSAIPMQFDYRTLTGGIVPGMSQTVACSALGIADVFLIQAVELRTVLGTPMWTVRAVNGSLVPSWKQALKALANKGGGITMGGTTEASIVPPDGLTYTPLVDTAGTLSIENIAVANPGDGVDGIDIYPIAIDELTCDPDTGAWYILNTTMNPTTDPVTISVTKNPACNIAVDDPAPGDWVLFVDPGSFEIAQISSIGSGTWTLARHWEGTPEGEAVFNSLMASHATGVHMIVIPQASRRFLLNAQAAGYDVASLPSRMDMALPAHCVLAIVAAPYNSGGYGTWVVYNLATATCPGLRTFVGGEFDLPYSGNLTASEETNRQISISVDTSQPIRVVHARVDTAPEGDDIKLSIRRSIDGGDTWTELYELTIADGFNESWPPGSPPEHRTEPYTGEWPHPILAAGNLLNFSIEQVGSETAGAGLMIKINT